MKNFYLTLCLVGLCTNLFSQITNTQRAKKENIIVNHENSFNNSARKLVDCSQTSGLLYCEDFESTTTTALPDNLATFSEEDNYVVPILGVNESVTGFYIGDGSAAREGGFWQITDHGKFAMTNDDACRPAGSIPNENNNCDLSFEVLQLPTLDFSGQPNVYIQFEYFHDKLYRGGDAMLEVSTNGGTSWIMVGDILYEGNGWQLYILNLEDYLDSTAVDIRIIWSDDNNWGTGFAIDDIQVGALPDYNVSLIEPQFGFPSSFFGVSGYNITPLNQAMNAGYNFYGYLKNTGVNTLDSARINAQITSPTFATQSYGLNLESIVQDTLFCNDVFIATSTGQYSANLNASTDNSLITEDQTVSFEVSEFIYARDLAQNSDDFTGGAFINDQGTEQRGNTFDIYTDADLYGVRVRFHPRTTPNALAKIYLNEVGVTNDGQLDVVYLTETNFKEVGSYTNDWVDIAFTNPIPVNQGDVIAVTVFAEFDGLDTVALCLNGNSTNGESIVEDITGLGANAPNSWFTSPSTPMIRLNFDPNIQGIGDPVNINEIEKLKIGVHPNPNNGEFQLSLNSENSKDLNLSIHNVLGQEVYNESLQSVVTLTKSLNLSHLEKGIYNIILSDKIGRTQTQKIIIQ